VTSPFEDWISDAPQEVAEWRELTLPVGEDDDDGGQSQARMIPKYLQGTLVRNGGGVWSAGQTDRYSHIFDGLAKVSAWKLKDGKVYYRNQFIQSHMYKTSQSQGKLPPTITVGPILSAQSKQPQAGIFRTIQAIVNSIRMDNAPVNVWDFDPAGTSSQGKVITARTDVASRAALTLEEMETVSTQGAIGRPIEGLLGIVATESTHPMYSLTSDDSYNVGVALTLRGFEVALYKESPNGRRTLVASVPPHQGKFAYTHSFGITDRYAVVVLQPLRLDMVGQFDQLLQKGFLRCMENVKDTEVIVFDLEEGSVVFHESIPDQVYFYHTISTIETANRQGECIVSLRLCAYSTPDIVNGEDDFLRLERAFEGRERRNKIPTNARFCDVVANLDSKTAQLHWIQMKEDQPFELPTTRYSRAFGPNAVVPRDRHARYVYAYGAYANGSQAYDDRALFKFDMEQRCIVGCLDRDDVYPSEPIFVANPEGEEEDDGVVLSQIYDGDRRETALVVLDAKTMKVLVEVWSGHASPMDFHGGWFP
jgi:beta,beta-carotene 9',10'-dioxygenase